MKTHPGWWVALGAALLLPQATANDDAPAPPAEVARWLGEVARPIEPAGGGLEAMRELVGSARIVAIGEATHGTHEFFAFKRDAFEFLARELGFTDFAMETGFSGALDTDRWLATGAGTLEQALNGLANLWRTEEYRELL